MLHACVLKVHKRLVILFIDAANPDSGVAHLSSTVSGAFNNQPDQIAKLGGDLLYFCEDGGKDCGVHARDRCAMFACTALPWFKPGGIPTKQQLHAARDATGPLGITRSSMAIQPMRPRQLASLSRQIIDTCTNQWINESELLPIILSVAPCTCRSKVAACHRDALNESGCMSSGRFK